MAGRGTTATVALERAGIGFTVHEYAHDPRHESYGREIGRLLRQLNAGGQTLVLVTHDPELAERYAARTVRIVDGRLAGAPAGVYR
jgi:predicted ABC-type transport system involved in lysophospholipase L1 biosynthesis ATPase subunit